MDYEKEYKDAIKRAKAMIEIAANQDEAMGFAITIFPVLKESEDEKIRKEIIYHIQHCDDTIDEQTEKRMLAWLEKQDEKTNPYSGVSFEYNGHIWGMCARDNGVDILLDKQLFKHLEKQGANSATITKGNYSVTNAEVVSHPTVIDSDGCKCITASTTFEPIFKVGEWIIRCAEGFKHNTYLVKEVKDYYVCEDLKGRRVTFTFNDVHKNFKLWDISDATKEQRDLLFQKMKEAGYEWNAEKKELKKIVKNCIADNSYETVKFPFKAKACGKIVTIHDGQLNGDGTKWIKYQSDDKDGFKIYLPEDLEPVEDDSDIIEEGDPQPMSYGKELDEKMYKACELYNNGNGEYSQADLFFAGVRAEYERAKKNVIEWKPTDNTYYDDISEILCNILYSERYDTINKDAIRNDLDWLISIKERLQGKEK